MAILLKDKEITDIGIGKKTVLKVYYGTKLVWERLISCFAKGWWVNYLPWTNNLGWRNDD